MPGEQKTDASQKELASTEAQGSLPSISLPKGGGAIRGIGEKFGANPVTGTGSLSVPIFTTGSRSDFYPKLSLSYDSGSGNGPFGLGWSLSVPSITRKTDKGLPRYADAEESDVFILSEAEDLVPELVQNGSDWIRKTYPASLNTQAYTVNRYRPRVEGLFARIERWRNDLTGETFWKTVSRDNIASIYGRSASNRIADPDDASRVFKWLLELSYDAKGNAIAYEYKPENRDNAPASIYEQNRKVSANRCLKRIKYGFQTPYYPDDTVPRAVPVPPNWLFQVVFDYGEHDLQKPTVEETTLWEARPDAFSSYRAGFEIRTYRLCRRVLMFHQFAELGATPYLVRSTDFQYSKNLVASYLVSVTQSGYIRNSEDGSYSLADPKTGEVLSPKSLPQIEFTYTQVEGVDLTVHVVDATSLANIPRGVDGSRYQWLDLDSEGSPGILTEQADAWFYKRNVSNLPRDSSGHIVFDDGASGSRVSACFEPVEVGPSHPSLAALSAGRQQFLDLAGEGRPSLVQYGKPVPGFYERDDDGGWQPFVPFSSSPNVDWGDPNLRFVDLDGDGFPDVLIAEHEVFTWYRSHAKDGFGSANRVPKPFDEESGPALIFADATQSIYLADFSGDGLTDIVRIRNGEVCYWPNLGYGRFGAKITMDGSPVFDSADDFNQSRIRLADTDGSGTTDIIYLGRRKTCLWFNQSGNSWSDPHELPQFPATDDVESLSVLDLLGNGTACIVWSSPLPGDSTQPMRYIDLMGGQKPHLLVSVKNNLGSETRVQYAASTRFYLLDWAAGRPWITKLPFPIHVVERVETFDYVSNTKLVSKYKYHHGYYDGVEREFRGFGMVEQVDTESFSKYSGIGLFTQTPGTEGEEFHLPPVHTKSWFHTGVFFSLDNILRHYQDEYFQGDAAAVPLPDMDLPSGLSPDEIREACRALKGRLLRQEVYSDDASGQARIPYSVTEYSYQLRLIQPRLNLRHAVFYANQSEALAYHYERNPQDPRITHELNLEVDHFGNPTKTAMVAYPRRPGTGGQPPISPEQSRLLVTYTENDVINKDDQADWYRIGLPAETRSFELTGVSPSSPSGVFALDELLATATTAAQIPYEAIPGSTSQKRLMARTRTLYRKNDLSGPSPLGEVESLALPYETYKMAFTPGLLTKVYSAQITIAALVGILSGERGYLNLDGDGIWWAPSGRLFYSLDPVRPDLAFARQHFYLPQGFQDPFENTYILQYDIYDLAARQSSDPLQNVVIAQYNYRLVLPWLITDANRNRSGVRLDALGMIIATAVMGKEGANEGDVLDLSVAETSASDDPTTRIVYSVFNWMQNNLPNFVHTFAREQHGAANPRWQESYSYSDGMGREVMKKAQAEPGSAPARDGTGALKHDANGKLIFQFSNSRWVGSGRTVFDNKGNPIKKYEPFFDSTNAYEDEKELTEWGVTSILRYDPVGRLIRTDNPNGTFSKVEFDAWQQITSDENDTVLDSRWYSDRASPDPNGPEPADSETRAAWLAAKHANTPGVARFDTLGRTFLTIADNATAGKYQTHSELDIQGNQRSVTDALGRKVMTYDYQMLGIRIHSVSIDAGERWLLHDVKGSLIRSWDSRDHQVRQVYDSMRRPTQLLVQTGNAAEVLAERVVYGEGQPHDQELNLRTRVYQRFDGAGSTTNKYDFKGNLVTSERKLLANYHDPVDWSQSPELDDGPPFTSSTSFDALDRPVMLTMPDGSVIHPIYNEANLLEQLTVNLRGAAIATPFVTNIDYNEKAQRVLIEYGNGANTTYEYDPETFRLTELKTTRITDKAVLQDLNYTYDPVGNITSLRDKAQQPVYFNNQVVAANANYAYDALYRLTSGTGREHIGQLAQPQTTWDDLLRMNQPLPTDGQAMRNYAENYAYDPVGNILRVVHQATNGNWTRTYAYDEPNVPATNNRLTSAAVASLTDSYQYDAHGNITRMPHLPTMDWDFKDQLHRLHLQGGGTAYYVYDAAGQRARKVIERQGGIVEERLYLGGFEIYRKSASGDITLERETLHVMDDKRRIALVETKTIDTTASASALPVSVTRYQFDNHLGSAVLEFDENAAIISYEEYYPYGSTSYQAVRAGVEVSSKRYRYTDKERDQESGLYYHGARYYAPWLGRWASCDPAALVDGTNLYEYGRANPIRFTDFSGKAAGDPSSRLEDQQIVEVKTDNVRDPAFVPHPDPPASWKARWAAEDYAVAIGARQGPVGYDRPSNLGWGPTFTTKQLAWDQVIFARDLAANLPFALDALPEVEALGAGAIKLGRALFSEEPGAALNVLKEMLSIGTTSRISEEGHLILTQQPSTTLPTVVLGEGGLPLQIHRVEEIAIGPAYGSLEEAVAASPGGHQLEVIVRARGQTNTLVRWFEASEKGLPEMLGHTEQKAVLRMNLNPELEIEMRGFHPPCPYGSGCMNALQVLADRTGATFTYRAITASDKEAVYEFIPGQ